MQNQQPAQPNGRVSKAKTANYKPSVTNLPEWQGAFEGGYFTLTEVDRMRSDSQIELCLEYKTAPLYNAEFEITAKQPQVQAYVEKQIQRFWQHSLQVALESLPYGRSGSEVLTKEEGGYVHLHSLSWLHPRDTSVFTRDGELAWVQVRNVQGESNVQLFSAQGNRLPECAWFVYGAKRNRWYGRSILFPAWWYWRTKTMPDGANETLFKWFYRHAYNGMVMRHPDEEYMDDAGNIEYAKDIARQLAQSIKTGADIELPSERFEGNNELKWFIEKYGGESNGDATKLIAYIDWLDKQMSRGILIPDLILTQDGATGSYSRSQVALTAFFMAAEQMLNYILETFTDQVLRPLVNYNFGPQPFTIKPKPLISQQQQADQGQSGQPALPPGQGQQAAQQKPTGGGMVQGYQRNGKFVQPYQRHQHQRFSIGDIASVLTVLGNSIDDSTAAEPQSHSYASTQFNLPDKVADQVKEFAATILDSEIVGDGRESTIHCTIKYGLHDDNPSRLVEVLKGFGPVSIVLGATSYFPAAEGFPSGDSTDVLKIEAFGSDLFRLNRLISENVANTETWPVYKPHVTIAYMQPGTAQKYAGDSQFDGVKITFDQLTFCPANGEPFEVPLTTGAALRMSAKASTVLFSTVTPEPSANVTFYANLRKELKEFVGEPTRLSAFEEAKHPRADDGKFSEGESNPEWDREDEVRDDARSKEQSSWESGHDRAYDKMESAWDREDEKRQRQHEREDEKFQRLQEREVEKLERQHEREENSLEEHHEKAKERIFAETTEGSAESDRRMAEWEANVDRDFDALHTRQKEEMDALDAAHMAALEVFSDEAEKTRAAQYAEIEAEREKLREAHQAQRDAEETEMFSRWDIEDAEIDKGRTTRLSVAGTEEGDEYRALAEMYAEHWNDLAAVGMQIPERELHQVGEELANGNWLLAHDGGKWVVKPAEEAGTIQMAVAHAPKGGIEIAGKAFRGGQFIPGQYVAQATPEQKAMIEPNATGNNAQTRRQRGSVDVAGLKEKVKPHAAQADAPDRFQRRYRKLAYNALKRHHGELLHHRLEELIGDTEKALQFIDDDHPNAEGLRNQFRQRLAAYGEMVDRAELEGITGKVEGGATKSAPEEEQGIREQIRPQEPTAVAAPSEQPAKQFGGIRDATAELDAIRNDLASMVPDDNLGERVDAVGKWVAAHGGTGKKATALLQEAHALADKIAGGSGKGGTRITPVLSEEDEDTWHPENHIKIAADSIEELRHQDVYRLLSSVPAGREQQMANYIRKNRPEFSAEIHDAQLELENERKAANTTATGQEPQGDLTADIGPSAPMDVEPPKEAMPKEPGFTGETTDSLGRKYHWVNGKRVPGPKDEQQGLQTKDNGDIITTESGVGDELETVGTRGDHGGISAQEPVGTPTEAASSETVPATGEGTPGDAGLRGLPGSPDLERDAVSGQDGGAGDGTAGGEGAGDGAVVPETAGRAGQDGTVGDGGGGDGGNVGSGASVDTASTGEKSLSEPATPENPTDLAAGNWRYDTRDFAKGGAKAKFRANIDAIRTLRNIRLEGRDTATPAEQAVISRYTGWGAFPVLFNEYGKYGGEDAWEWKRERDEFRSLLSDDEYESAKRSTLNAHYTSPDIVDAHWKMAQRLGFKGGRFLETSAGIGYYFGQMPAELASKTRSSAVEKDQLTGNLLKMLYPSVNTEVGGFEEHQANDNFYDLVASNVPFGDYRVHDERYNKHQAAIHDYFFLKSADVVRPGGLVMHITSTGTLDKQDSKIREELAKTCDLVSAVRFPGGAHKENAGTEVVTDMLILRKRMPGEQPVSLDVTPPEAMAKEAGFTGMTTDSLGRVYHWKDGKRVPGPNWLDTAQVPDPAGGEPITVNKYFADNPEQILGKLDRTGSMRQGDEKNVSKTDDYEDRLQAAIDRLPEGLMKQQRAPKERFSPETAPAPGDTKQGGYGLKDGKLYVRDRGQMVEQQVSPDVAKRIAGQLSIRDAFRAQLNAETEGRDATAERAALNEAYDAYVAKHGFLNDRANKNAFRTDPDSPVMLALEHYDPKTKKATKADAFTKDTVRAAPKVTKAGSVDEAIGVSLHESGGIDVERIAGLTGKTSQQVGAEMLKAGLAFDDPSEGWKPADQYLSGNVRRKLALARAAAKADPKYQPNVDALEEVQPEDVDHGNIDVRCGAAWVPPSDVANFAASLLDGRGAHFDIIYHEHSATWAPKFSKEGKRRLENSRAAQDVWATKRVDFMDLLDHALNNTTPTVWDKDADGNRYVNKDATDDARAKVQDFKKAWEGWIWDNDERRERLHRVYNDNYNNIRPISYDGSHQKFPGMNPAVDLRDHQKNFVWQVVTTGKGLAAHEVGTGKTYSMIASAMELRRLGLAKKPMIACLKANIEGITADALRLYPGAKILSTADMFDADSRKKTISQIATGDYDMVIMTHDHMDMMQMKPETQAKYIRDEIAELEAAKYASEQDDPSKGNRIVKELEKAKASLEAKLKAALDTTGKDDAVYFEDLGIDQIFVDEAHKYKSLPVYTKQRGMKGIPTSRSERATSMKMRTRWLMEKNGGRGVVFATGTPVANTMAELYTMQQYLQPNELKERKVDNFDAWASVFGDIDTKNEFTVSGEYKPVSRFAKFTNIPELMQVVRQMMDVQRVDGMTNAEGKSSIVRPKRTDHVIASPESQAMTDLMKSLQERAKNLKRASKDNPDNMLVICTDGRKGSIDMRLLDANAADDPESKTNKCVDNVLKIHKEKPGKTQIIFSDIGVNANQSGFHLYGDVIDKLVKGGIPREAIADFSQFSDAKKEAAQQAMREGKILVAIGSTEKLGTGVNVQNKLSDLHHLDVPWLPASVEQRDGRGWRQGNENKDVNIHRYVTEGSLDQTFWQIIGNKTRFIKQIITNADKAGIRIADDSDTEELSPDQLMAAASGDPRIMEKVNLEQKAKDLESDRKRHEREQIKFKDAVKKAEGDAKELENRAKRFRADASHLEANPDFHLKIGGQSFTERKDAAEALKTKIAEADEKLSTSDYTRRYGEETIGTYRGMAVTRKGGKLYVQSKAEGREYEVGDSVGSLDYMARNLSKEAAQADQDAERAKGEAENIKGKIGAKFPHTDELAKTIERVKAIEAELKGKDKDKEESEPASSGEIKERVREQPEAKKQYEPSPLDKFEDEGGTPESISQADWVALQRAHRRHLGQSEESGTAHAPNSDYEQYHRDSVARAVKTGKEVKPEVLKDYPDLAPKPTASADIINPPQAPAPTPAPKPTEPAPTKFFISGNTYTHKDKIKAVGGRWDGIRKGWVIPASAKSKVEHLSGLKYEGVRMSNAQWDAYRVLLEDDQPIRLSTDSTGHEHKGSGPGGGQFTTGSTGGKAEPAKAKSTPGESVRKINVNFHRKIGDMVKHMADGGYCYSDAVEDVQNELERHTDKIHRALMAHYNEIRRSADPKDLESPYWQGVRNIFRQNFTNIGDDAKAVGDAVLALAKPRDNSKDEGADFIPKPLTKRDAEQYEETTADLHRNSKSTGIDNAVARWKKAVGK